MRPRENNQADPYTCTHIHVLLAGRTPRQATKYAEVKALRRVGASPQPVGIALALQF